MVYVVHTAIVDRIVRLRGVDVVLTSPSSSSRGAVEFLMLVVYFRTCTPLCDCMCARTCGISDVVRMFWGGVFVVSACMHRQFWRVYVLEGLSNRELHS